MHAEISQTILWGMQGKRHGVRSVFLKTVGNIGQWFGWQPRHFMRKKKYNKIRKCISKIRVVLFKVRITYKDEYC